MDSSEQNRLDAIGQRSIYSAGVMSIAIRHCAEVFGRHLAPGSILELGPAEGLMTDELVRFDRDLTVVEGVADFCSEIRTRHPGIKVVNSLFETYEPAETFGNIVLGHVLEHVENPVGLLKYVKNWLRPGGRILAAVPNSQSLHRQAGVLMGLLAREDDLNERDIANGHRRVYNPERLRADFESAGCRIESFGGYWMKPLTNTQLEANWEESMLKAFMCLGERYPELAGEIYIVAS